jgi:hypothetical protein
VPIGQHNEEEGGRCPWASTPFCGLQENTGSQVSRNPNLDMTNSLISVNVKVKFSNMADRNLIKAYKVCVCILNDKSRQRWLNYCFISVLKALKVAGWASDRQTAS